MRIQRICLQPVSSVVVAAAICLLVGCELSAPNGSLRISPSSAVLDAGQTQEFTASGGAEYTWSVADPRLGSLDVDTDDHVVYTSASTNGTQTITVTSILGTSAISNTNATQTMLVTNANGSVSSVAGGAPSLTSTETATATVFPPAVQGAGTLTIEPTQVILAGGQKQRFTAHGGDGNYTWYVEDQTLGSLDASTGDSVTYTHNTSWPNTTQTITVNSAGQSAQATIFTSIPGAVVVQPTAATLANGQSQTLTADGGDGNYTWTVKDQNLGTLDATSGRSVKYTCRATQAGTVQIVTVGSAQTTATATITSIVAGGNMAVLPTRVTLKQNQTQTFTASGGDGTYAWYLERPGAGNLSATTGSSVSYTATDPSHNQTITVASAGLTATASVTQEP